MTTYSNSNIFDPKSSIKKHPCPDRALGVTEVLSIPLQTHRHYVHCPSCGSQMLAHSAQKATNVFTMRDEEARQSYQGCLIKRH